MCCLCLPAEVLGLKLKNACAILWFSTGQFAITSNFLFKFQQQREEGIRRTEYLK